VIDAAEKGGSFGDRSMMRWIAAVVASVSLQAGAIAATVVTAEIRGGIGPASASYFARVLDSARASRADLVVVSIDTPGGLDRSMRDMIQALLASPVPVAMFVSPSGSRAASAGTYLLYASHVAAMAPGTNLGAATPVAIGIGGDAEKGKPGDKDKSDDAKAPKSPMEAKAMHDAAAYLRSLAQMRGRNAEWSEKAVRQSESLSADEALKLDVIDVVATDVPDLLKKLDGRTVKTAEGAKTLALADATASAIAPNWKEQLLGIISDPNIALLLMMAGVYGLLFEFMSPGTAVPGVAGSIALLLGLYGLALLPVNYVAVALLLLGLGMMVAEAFLPTFGVIGVGGIVAFVAGVLMLIDADIPGFTIQWGLVLPIVVANALVLAAIGAYALRSRSKPPVAGAEAMVGASVEALEDFDTEGWVRAFGERWRARTNVPMKRGARARIKAIEGLMLILQADDNGGTR
jgi:membrane-bound serine protease (ClpP class)